MRSGAWSGGFRPPPCRSRSRAAGRPPSAAWLAGVVAWDALHLLVPLPGFALLLVCAAYAVWKRRLSLPVKTVVLLGLFALWPSDGHLP